MIHALLPILLVASPGPEPPTLLLTNARVWTADAARPWAEAVAIRGERIVFVGSATEAESLRAAETRVEDLGGALLLPGFNDAHIHLMSGALALERVDLIEDTALEGVQERIRAFAVAHPERPWVLGRGWLYGAFPEGMPVRQQLDAVVADRPAYMECYDGHTGWANSKALAVAGITRETPDPPNGEIVRDARGEPTGALKEAAVGLVESHIPAPDEESRYRLLVQALAELSSRGVTSVQDAGYAPEDARRMLRLLERARRESRLSVRVALSIQLEPDAYEGAIEAARALAETHAGPWLRVGAVKAYVDGVVESRTAAMLEPYPGGAERGRPNWAPEALQSAVTAADRAGLQVYLHAIGDRGVRMALDAHEAARRANGPRDRRGRIEHIETIHPDDDPRFAELGVIASMQPLHADPNPNIFAVWAVNAGPKRARRAFGWRSLEVAGARLAFGSDWPVVTSDARRGLYCAVTRRTRDGVPEGGWLPEEAVTLESALRHYTVDAAYASFEENEKGTLAAGRLADLVALSADPFQEGPAALLRAAVRLTVVGGRVVYEDGQ